MDTHGNMMNATTNLVGLRGQSKNENINTRSSSVARLHTNINAMNNNPNNHLSSTQPRQVANGQKRGQQQNVTSKQRQVNSNMRGGGHMGSQQP